MLTFIQLAQCLKFRLLKRSYQYNKSTCKNFIEIIMKYLKIHWSQPSPWFCYITVSGQTLLITCDCNEMQSAERDKFTWVQK